MNPNTYKTLVPNKKTVQKQWLLVDAKDQVLGRLASKVAFVMRGKHKTNFSPHIDCGDNVVLVNADKIVLTGKKWENKAYRSYTGYPGGQRTISPKELKAKHPTRIIAHAVKGMLPKNRLGRKLLHNLFLYTGAAHPHAAQQPTVFTL